MAAKGRGARPPERAAYRRETYKGHEILFPEDERKRKFFIDGRPVHFGITADETYYLDVYAYDPVKSLDKLVRRYLDYRERSARRAGKDG